MRVHTRNGCPICHSNISGNVDLGYLCGRCRIIFPSHRLPKTTARAKLMTAFPKRLFLRSSSGETYHVDGCKYARRIQDPVPVVHTDGLRACVCTRKE